MRQPAPWAIAIASAVGLGVVLFTVVVVIPALQNRLTYGTFSTQGPPPRIDYRGRTYSGLTQVGTTPSGMPVLAHVMPPTARAFYHTDVCAMTVWVKTGPDRYLPYGLSGGP